MDGLSDEMAAIPRLDEAMVGQLEALSAGPAGSLLQIALAAYRESAPGLIDAIRQGMASGDGALVCSAGHSLKGSSASLGAARLAAIAQRLEAAGRTGDLAAAHDAIETLTSEHERVMAELDERAEDAARRTL